MKNAKIINVDQVEARTPAGGDGLWKRLIDANNTESGLVFGFGSIKPGESRGWHIHPAGEDEILFVIEGNGLAEWEHDGKRYQKEISSGTAFYTPGLMEHNITNIGEDELLNVYCTYRPDKY